MFCFVLSDLYSAEIKAKSMVDVNTEYKLVTFDNGSVWVMPIKKSTFYWQTGINGGNVVKIDVPDNLRMGQTYNVEHRWLSGEEEKLHEVSWQGVFICQPGKAVDESSVYGVVLDYEIIDIASIPTQLGLGNTIFLLNDGSYWLAPAHFSNVRTGELLQAQKVNDKTAIILKTFKWNNENKEIFIHAKKLVNGIYLLQ